MAARVFLYHVVGDLTLGKPDLVEFRDTETVETAARAIASLTTTDASIAVWGTGAAGEVASSSGAGRASRFLGMVSALDLVAFIARVGDQEKALSAPVSQLLTPNPSLLKEVDPATRLIDALEMMKQGVRFLLVRKSILWTGMSKRFSEPYHAKWLRKVEAASIANGSKGSQPISSLQDSSKYCCLSREDVTRFIIGCLGAIAPIPLTPISVLGAMSPCYSSIEASAPAIEATQKTAHDPCAIAVVEVNADGMHKIIGEISAYKLWKCDHLAAAWAMSNLSAGQFVMGAEDSNASPRDVPDFSKASQNEDAAGGANLRHRKFSSRNIGFYSKPVGVITFGGPRNIYRGRSAPLTCKRTSSLAAVMAQMLSHRATHVWVTEEGSDILLGVVSYTDIFNAVTMNPFAICAAVPCE